MARKRNGDQPAPAAAGSGGNKPVYRKRFKGGIQLSIWENQSGDNRWYSAKLTRRYKDDQSGEWRSTDSMNPEHFLAAAEAWRQGWLWVSEQAEKGAGDAIPE